MGPKSTSSKPSWMRSPRTAFSVFPEDQPEMLQTFASRPQRKVVYCQNHFYAAMSMPDSRTYADFGVSHILCSGQTIHDYCRHRHPEVPAYVIPIGVNPQQFYPRPFEPALWPDHASSSSKTNAA